jgi:hypothetical protein
MENTLTAPAIVNAQPVTIDGMLLLPSDTSAAVRPPASDPTM